MGRRAVIAILLSLPLTHAVAVAGAPAENRIRAAIVCNLARVVTWPADVADGPFLLDVAGIDVDGPDFPSLAGKEVHGREVVVRIWTGEDVADLVFVSRSEEAACDDLLAAVATLPVLTVSEMEGFCARGGIVQLVRRRDRIGMLVNRDAAAAAGLQLSSQLLKVAEIYEGGR